MNLIEWLDRNLGTVAGILLAFSAFAATLADGLPGKAGAILSSSSIIAVLLARAIVHGLAQLTPEPEPPTVVNQTFEIPLEVNS